MIEIKDLIKTYHLGEETVNALAGVSLSIPTGQFTAFIGPSGSGKSTLLHLIGGLDTPTSGTIVVDGQNLSQATDKELAVYRNTNIGFVFQAFHLHPIYNALENVAIPLIFSGLPKEERLKRAAVSLEAVGLTNRAGHRPNELSGGERQRVSIARALVINPKYILADEPTGNLDSVNGAKIMDILISLHKNNGITLIISTHDKDIARNAQRVISLKDGHITGDTNAP
ncbi:MAG: ABC transporter ATP-binding protein [Dehalococcoidales bacterium]|nr:ABC transporter ATP-binding protein [Dehalococcoidales bacterium]